MLVLCIHVLLKVNEGLHRYKIINKDWNLLKDFPVEISHLEAQDVKSSAKSSA